MPQLGEGHRRIGVRICESGVEAHRNGKGVGCRPERVEAEVRTAEVVWHGRVRGPQRSEERRVGKEGRSRWSREHEKKNIRSEYSRTRSRERERLRWRHSA